MKETDWFGVTTVPARTGVYKTRHRGHDGKIIDGYSHFIAGKWSYTAKSAWIASRNPHSSPQQSREWCGLAEKPE